MTNFKDIATNGKKLNTFVNSTIRSYNSVATKLHHAACMTLFHIAQYGEGHALNTFYNGLRKNDQTALRLWIGKHTQYVDLDDDGKTKNWIAFTAKDGFRVVKGKEQYRKDVYDLDDLIALDPFYNKDVRDPKAFDLAAAITMLKKAVDNVNSKSEKNNVALPESITRLLKDASTIVAEEAAKLEKEAA